MKRSIPPDCVFLSFCELATKKKEKQSLIDSMQLLKIYFFFVAS